MTLLVLGVQVPDLPAQHSEADLARSLVALWPEYLNYALSFLIASAFWIGHHQILGDVRRVDRRFLWLNMLSLLSIGGIPFMTLILGRYGGERVAVDAFAAFMALVALLQVVLRLDATHNRRLVDSNLDLRTVRYQTFYSLLVVVIFAGSIGVSFWRPWAAEVTWGLTWLVVGLAHPNLRRLLGRTA
jgi:uncharacterized membrane protein